MEIEDPVWLEALVGGALLVITMVMHGVGMYCVVSATRPMLAATERFGQPVHAVQVISVLVALTLTAHLLEILLWAVILNGMDLVSPMRHAINFVALTYTTLGAPTSLPEQWLLLEAACCVAGTLTFAWTTAVMFQILNRVFEWHYG